MKWKLIFITAFLCSFFECLPMKSSGKPARKPGISIMDLIAKKKRKHVEATLGHMEWHGGSYYLRHLILRAHQNNIKYPLPTNVVVEFRDNDINPHDEFTLQIVRESWQPIDSKVFGIGAYAPDCIQSVEKDHIP